MSKEKVKYKIVEAFPEDFNKIYPLLRQFKNTRLSKNNWKNLFIKNWDSNHQFIGIKALHNNKVIGFIAIIFSVREFDKSKVNYAQISSIIVDEAYRGKGIANLIWSKVINLLKECVIVGFNPVSYTLNSYLKQGYHHISNEGQFIYCFGSFKRVIGYISEDAIYKVLSPNHFKYYADHQKFGIIPIVIKLNNNYLYLLVSIEEYFYKGYKRLSRLTNYIQLKYGVVHYVNDTKLLVKNLSQVRSIAFRKLGLIGLHINENQIGNSRIWHSKKKKTKVEIIYKHSKESQVEIDTLYSELFLLN